MPSLDITKVTAGIRGAFFLNGVKYAECQDWKVALHFTRTKEQVLDDEWEYSIEQAVGATLEFGELTIKHLIAQQVLAAIQNKQLIAFNFRGEVKRPDGSVGACDMVQCVPDGEFPLMGTQVGQTMKQKFQWALNAVPTLTPLS